MIKVNTIKKRAEEIYANRPKNQGGLLGGAEFAAKSLAAGVGSIGEGVVDIFGAAGNLIVGDVEGAKDMFRNNVVGDWYAAEREEYNPDGVMSFVGDTLHGIGQSAVLFIPYAGAPLFYAGIVSQGVSSAAAITGEVGLKEIAYGVTTGALEGILDKALGGAASKVSNAVKGIGKNAGKSTGKALFKATTDASRKGLMRKILSSGASEFVEEFASEYADTLVQRAYLIDPTKQYSLKDAIYSGFVGMASGMVTTSAVEIPRSINYASKGRSIIDRGNSQTLVNTATVVADKLANKGTNFKNAAGWVTALRGQVDAYNNLVKKGKGDSASAATILGEMQAYLSYAETKAVHAGLMEKIEKASDEDKAALAEYINMLVDKENRKKDYTAEDITNNTDEIASQLAIMQFAGMALDYKSITEDAMREKEISDAIANERNASTEEAPAATVEDAPFAEAMAKAEETPAQVAETVEIGQAVDTESAPAPAKTAADIKRGVKNATNKIEVQGKLYEISEANIDGISNRAENLIKSGVSETDAVAQAIDEGLSDIRSLDEGGKLSPVFAKARIAKIKGAIINAYRQDIQNEAKKAAKEAKLAEDTETHKTEETATEEKIVPEAETKTEAPNTSNYTKIKGAIVPNKSAQATKTKEAPKQQNTKVEEKSSDRTNESSENKTEPPKVSEAKESLTDEQRAERARKKAEQMLKWELNNTPTVNELNTAREYVKGFDNLSPEKRQSIIRMMRTAKGIDVKIVKGIANLMAIKAGADLDLRFDEEVSEYGVSVKSEGRTLIIISSKTDFKKTIKGTVAHELVHYLENKSGYEAFAKHVLKRVKPEKKKEVEDQVTKQYNEQYEQIYRKEYTKQGLKGAELNKAVKDALESEQHKAMIDSEVVAGLVGQALNSDKFLSRYARIGNTDGFIKKAYTFLRAMVKELKSKDKENNELADIIMPTIKSMDRLLQMESTGESKSGKRYAIGSNSGYDYTKPFYQQVEDYKNGLFPKDDSLLLGETPEVFKSIGFNSLPMTINQRHIDYALNGTKNADHEIGEVVLKYLPTALKKPVAVITSSTHKNTSVVAIVSITHNGNQIHAAVYVDGTGTLNGIEIHSNAITSVYSRKNAITKLLKDAIDDELNGKIGVYYWDKKRAVALLSGKKVTMPNTLNTLSDGSIHSIRENASPVKPKFENVTESQQFKRWFGDWQKHPNTASKVVNADGTPKILYHQTSEDFTVFDPRHKGAGTNDDETPFGIFMKPADNDIGLKGKKQMALYARIVKPLIVNDRADLVYRLKSLSPKYEGLIKQRDALSVEYKTKLEEAAKAWGQYAKDYRVNHPDATRSDIYNDPEFKRLYDAEDILTEEWIEKADDLSLQMKEEITKTLKANNYDGVILKKDSGSGGRTVETYIALEPTQVKSATDNIGTFDKNNRDIRYSLAPKTKNMNEKIAREAAENAKVENAQVFAKKDVEIAVRSIEGWTQEEILSLATGQENLELQHMNKAKREEMISQIYIALHEEGAKGRVGPGHVAVKALAANIASDYIDSAKIVGENNKSVHLKEIYDESSINQFKQDLTDLLYGEFAHMGHATRNADFQAIIRKQKEEFGQEQLSATRAGKESRNLAYQGKKLRELVEKQKRDATAEDIVKVTKAMADVIDAKGNIRVNAVDKAMSEASRFFEGEKAKIESEKNALKTADGKATYTLSDFAWMANDDIKFMIDEYLRLREGREGKALTAEEMRLASEVLHAMKVTIERYNKEYVNGHWIDAEEAAKDSIADLTAAWREKEYKNKVTEWLGNKVVKGVQEKYFYKILTPETIVETLEGFAKNGLLKSLYHSIRVHKQKAEHLAVQLKKPLAEFMDNKENSWTDDNGHKRSFRSKLNKKMISVNGANGVVDLTLGEAIYLFMLTKREAAHAGLLENGYIVYNDKNQQRAKLRLTDIENTRNNIYNAFDKTDLEFLEMAENFFDKTSSKIKYDADMNIFGYTNIQDGYYVPMIRDRYSRMHGVTDARQSIGSIITVYNKSFNQNLVENAKALEGKNIMSIISDHADGLADYSELYLPLKAFDRIYNRAIVTDDGITSIRRVLNNDVWNGTERYFKDLFADIQGQRDQRDNVVDNLVGSIRSAWVNSVLGANVKVVVTQTTSLAAATQVINAKYIAQTAYLASPGKLPGLQELRERAYKYSDIIEARNFDMGAIKAQGNIDKVTWLGEKSGWAIGWMDERICLAIFHAAELQIQAQYGHAVGTEENAKLAAKLADEAIYTTQAMSSASERSALQRSRSEVARMLSMFTSDTVKNLSHLYGNIMKWNAYRLRAKAGDATYDAEMKQCGRDIRRSIRTLACTGIMLGLITQGFKYLFAREEEDPEDKKKDFVMDIAGSTLNILPGVADAIDKLVFNYDLSINVIDVANDTLEAVGSAFKMAGKGMRGEYVSTNDVIKTSVGLGKTALSFFGWPVSPFERTVTGILRRVSPETVYGYDTIFGNASYTADLKKAVESGDANLAEHVLEQLYRDEINGTYTSEELSEIVRLYNLTDEEGKHYNVLPQRIPEEINEVKLNKAQRKQFNSIYSQASAKVNELIRSEEYKMLDDKAKAKAIRDTYELYYSRAAAEVAGKEWSANQAYSKLTDNYTVLMASKAYKSSLEAYKTDSGKEVTVKEQFSQYVKNLNLSDNDYLIVAYANGYKGKKTTRALLKYINSLDLNEAEKQQIAKALNFDLKNGQFTEKED